jgi:DNA ligase (NAD+)
MAQKSVSNLLQGIENSKQIPFERVLFALGIRYVGETVSKKLAKHFKNMNAILNASLEEMTAVDEIGEKIAESLYFFLQKEEHRELINRLKSYGLQFEIVETESTQVSTIFEGKTFVVSGVFENYSRNELKKTIEDYGGKNVGSISKKTDYLVAGYKMGPAKKEKAESLGVTILSEQEFGDMLD